MFSKQIREFRLLPAVLLSLPLLTVMGCDSDIGGLNLDLNFGTYTVITRTTGDNLDPDGYQLTIVGVSFNFSDPIGVNATRRLSVGASGLNTVTLGGIAANCTVDGPNPLTVDLSVDDDTATTLFEITCN